MRETKLSEIAKLKHYSLDELKAKYKELFGQESDSNNRAFLNRIINYRLQELELGGLSKAAQERISELIQQYDPINNKVFRPIKTAASLIRERNRKLPVTGSILRRKYKGQTIVVQVLQNGFEYNGKIYKKLTTISQEITGSHWSGYDFFGL